MITVLTGENSFEIAGALARITSSFEGETEQFDGTELEERQLPDLLMGTTLFSQKRLVIIKGLSENKTLWAHLGDWLERMSEDVHLVLVESKPDKRTKTFKDLKQQAEVYEFNAWNERDTLQAEQWVSQHAKELGLQIDSKGIQALVYKVGPDQWRLSQELKKLSVFEEVTPSLINESVVSTPSENVFNLLDAALRGDSEKSVKMANALEQTDDPYMVFGLLSSQVFQLAALAFAEGRAGAEIAKDIGAHPFALQKLTPYARRLGKSGARQILRDFAAADERLKSTANDPWMLIEQTLVRVASRV